MSSENYYSDTAFDSSKPVSQKAASKKKTFVQRSAEKHALKGNGVYCSEFTAIQDMDLIEILNDDSPEAIEDKNHPAHEFILWFGLKNPRVKVETMTTISAFIAIFGGGLNIFFLVITGFSLGAFYGVLLWLVLPYILYKAGKIALKKNWIKDKHNTELGRRTGMVTFSWGKKRVSYPFAEFDPAMQSVVDRTGLTSYYLILMHRYTGQFCRHPTGNYEEWKVEMDWEELHITWTYQNHYPIPRLWKSYDTKTPSQKNGMNNITVQKTIGKIPQSKKPNK